MKELPENMGRRFASGMAAQVGASAAASALSASHINALLTNADTDATLAVTQGSTT